MLLHKNKETFSQIVSIVSDYTSLNRFQIEKDYYVTMFLRELSDMPSELKIVLKGGTSLSKCYQVIKRFSEDIDLAIEFNSRKVSNAQRRELKSLILKVIDNLGFRLLNEDDIKSGMDHNEYHIGYDNQFGTDLATVPHIIIETIVAYKPYPCERKTVNNYITTYLQDNNRSDLIKEFRLDPFNFLIQTIERTFLDKMFAICDYHLDSKYNRHSRHIYDVYMIWESRILDMELLKSIIQDVIMDRQIYGNKNKSCIPGVKPDEILHEIIEKEVYKDDFDIVTTQFVSEPIEYSICINGLKEILATGFVPSIIKDYSSELRSPARIDK